MAKDIIEKVVEKVDEEVVEEVVEEKVTDQHGSAMPDGFENAMDEALKTEEVSEETTEEEGEDTDEELVEETTDVETEVVEEKVSEETKVEKPEVEKPAEKPQEKAEEIKFDLDPQLVDPQVKSAIDSIALTLNKQQKAIAEEKESLRLEREKIFENRIDTCFDSLVTDLPDIGNTSSLTEQNGKYRRELFQHAHVTAEVHGIPIEEAIKDTVRMFKNRDGEQKATKQIITKLNKQKKSFTNSPTRKKSSPTTRKFANETEKANFIMDEAYKKAGIG